MKQTVESRLLTVERSLGQRIRSLYHLPSAVCRQQSGVILIGALMTLFFFMAVSLAIAEFGSQHYLSARRTLVALNALSVAEAGVDKFMYEINSNTNYSGSGGEVTLYSDNAKGKGTYETTVTNGAIPNEKIITSVGKMYLPASSATPLVTRKVSATIIGTNPLPYTVQTGPGGLILTNSATIGNGDVYVNGYIQMSNYARIGSIVTPSNVYVAHANCPTGGGPSYPEVCSSGQPITMANMARIYGTVRATNQTNGSGMSNPGLIAGSTAATVAMPTDDRAAQIAAVSNTISGTSASCNGSQTRTLQANTHITGNFTASNNCVVTVNGDIWIDGNFSLSNSAVFRVASGASATVRVMVDGSSGVTLTNSSAIATNTSGIGFRFVTYHSAAGCTPGCADVTGSDLYNSRDLTTITMNNGSLAAGSVFYARWSKVLVSNGGSVGAVIGQTVHLDNTGNISFGAISGGGGGTPTSWDVEYYQQSFN